MLSAGTQEAAEDTQHLALHLFSRRRMSSVFRVYVLPPLVTDRTFPFRCNAAVL